MKDGLVQRDALAWSGFRPLDDAVALAQIADLMASVAHELTPAELLTAVCEILVGPLGLTSVVLFKRVAGQCRTLVWSAPGVPWSSAVAARERAWSMAGDLLDGGEIASQRDPSGASVVVRDASLGLSAMIHAESRRHLDRRDRELLEEALREMVSAPGDRRVAGNLASELAGLVFFSAPASSPAGSHR